MEIKRAELVSFVSSLMDTDQGQLTPEQVSQQATAKGLPPSLALEVYKTLQRDGFVSKSDDRRFRDGDRKAVPTPRGKSTEAAVGEALARTYPFADALSELGAVVEQLGPRGLLRERFEHSPNLYEVHGAVAGAIGRLNAECGLAA